MNPGMTRGTRNPLSLIVLLLLFMAAWRMDLDLELWKQRDRVIEWDVHSYYAYLPAVFIYDDIRLEKSDYWFDEGFYLFWPSVAPNGGKVIKTTMGVAVLYSPFFFAAHAYAKVFGHPTDGWSIPYKVGLLAAGLFYFMLGSWLVRELLLRMGHSDLEVSITLLLIGAGTNLFCYATQSGSMSHVHSFFLIALFLLMVQKWDSEPTFRGGLQLGLLVGLITLVRPVNALIVIVFALLNVNDLRSLRQRFHFFLRNWPRVLLMGAGAILVWMPQLVYWKMITGSLLFNPYIGEGFHFGDPHVLDGLFSFRKGWLLYTPVMVFALIGLFFMTTNKGWRAAIGVFMIFFIYTTFSWWCWWYGGSFGQRSMVDVYALLALPLAAFIQWTLSWRMAWRVLAGGTAAALVWLNFFQTYQFERGSLHYDGMTKELYFSQFGKAEVLPDLYELADPPDYDKARSGGK
jgi:hypothetical protein